MTSSQAVKRLAIMAPLGCAHQVTAGPKVLPDMAEGEQEPLRLPW
jgi:hypothetical protein